MTLSDGSLLHRQIDEYLIDRALGTGGMAKVYRALDTKLKRYVALKVIAPGFRADPEYARRFEHEAQSIARLDHPNIVRIYRFGEADDLYYMAMQYIEGADVLWLIADYKAHNELMPLSDVVRIIADIGAALDYAHSQNVIHRDVKPANIVVDQQGRAILTDFGLALLGDLGTQGMIFGSPGYISPEQAQSSANVVPQSDLYALGVTLYEMLTGELPFPDGSATELAMRHMTEPPPPPSRFNPAIPPAVDDVLLRCLEKDPFDRYQTGQELSAALNQAVQEWQTGGVQSAEDFALRRPSLVFIPQKVDSFVTQMAQAGMPFWAQAADTSPSADAMPAQPPATAPVPASSPTQFLPPSTAARSAWQSPLAFGLGVFFVGMIGIALLLVLVRSNSQNAVALRPTDTLAIAPTHTLIPAPTRLPTRTAITLPTPTALVLNATAVPSLSLPTGAPAVPPSPVSATSGAALPTTPVPVTLLFSAAPDSFAVTNTSDRPAPLTALIFTLNGQALNPNVWGLPALNPAACLRISQANTPSPSLPPGCKTSIDYHSTGSQQGNAAWFSPAAAVGLQLSNVLLLLGGDHHWVAINNPSQAVSSLAGIKLSLSTGTVIDLSTDTLKPGDCLRFRVGTDPPRVAPAECATLQRDLPVLPANPGTLTVTLLTPATWG